MSGLGSGWELGCDQLHLVFFNDFLSSRCLCQFLVSLKHLFEEKQQRQDLVLTCAWNHDLSMTLKYGLFHLLLQSVLADKLMKFTSR